MSRRVLSEQTLQTLYEAFRSHPGHIADARRAAGVNYRTAQKAWEQGFPGRPGWERPMSAMILEEQEAARARIKELEATIQAQAADLEARRRADEKAKAIQDATETRVQEGQMIRSARAGAMGLLRTLNILTMGTARIGARMKDALDALADRVNEDGSPVTLSASEAGSMIQVCLKLADAMKKVVETGQTAMEMERLLLGEPQKIVGHQQMEEMTLGQAQAELEAGQRAIERARRRQAALEAGGTPSTGDGGAQGVPFQSNTGFGQDGNVH